MAATATTSVRARHDPSSKARTDQVRETRKEGDRFLARVTAAWVRAVAMGKKLGFQDLGLV